MKPKRLSDSEIRSAVDKIRKRYGDYMVQFLKERSALDAFEERYIQAMRARLDLALFLHVEMTVIEELLKKEQDHINTEQEKVLQKKNQQAQSRSLVDQVLEENRRRIAKYPPRHIHDDASEEIERLYGCLNTFERELWPDVEVYMRAAYTSSLLSPRMRLEAKIIALCRPGSGGLPPRLSRYRTLFDWVPRNTREIETEGKKCMLDAAFFLHDLSDVIMEMKKSGNLEPYELENVDKLLGYVHTLLDDFRLKDFKIKSR